MSMPMRTCAIIWRIQSIQLQAQAMVPQAVRLFVSKWAPSIQGQVQTFSRTLALTNRSATHGTINGRTWEPAARATRRRSTLWGACGRQRPGPGLWSYAQASAYTCNFPTALLINVVTSISDCAMHACSRLCLEQRTAELAGPQRAHHRVCVAYCAARIVDQVCACNPGFSFLITETIALPLVAKPYGICCHTHLGHSRHEWRQAGDGGDTGGEEARTPLHLADQLVVEHAPANAPGFQQHTESSLQVMEFMQDAAAALTRRVHCSQAHKGDAAETCGALSVHKTPRRTWSSCRAGHLCTVRGQGHGATRRSHTASCW